MHRNKIEDSGIYEVRYKVRNSEIVHSGIPSEHVERTLYLLEDKGIDYDVRQIGERE